MREIKFRVRDYFEEIWYFYNLLDFDCGKYKSVGGLCWDRDSIGLSTGLHDKNGVEIFESDHLETDEAGWIARVVFKRGRFVLLDNNGGFSLEPNWETCEVIGNEYENPHPELLEE